MYAIANIMWRIRRHRARNGSEERRRNAHRLPAVNLKEGVHLEDLSVNGRVIFNWILNVWTDFIWSTIGPVTGCCENGHERPRSLSRSIKRGEFLD